jgi:hypothetical protein
MPALVDAFRRLADERLLQSPGVAHEWSTSSNRIVLLLPPSSPEGFEVRVECESYGLYVHAEGWHGAPFGLGSLTVTPEATAENCLGFVRTLLSADSSLTVRYAGAKPFKWVLSYATDSGVEREEMGLLVFNYLGRRSTRTLQNGQLPTRYARSAA